jgi:hypothetical protein
LFSPFTRHEREHQSHYRVNFSRQPPKEFQQ